MAAHTKVGVGYNIQVGVDAKHKMIVEQTMGGPNSHTGEMAHHAGSRRGKPFVRDFQIGFVQMPSRMKLGRRVSGCRCSHDSATPDAFTFTMRYPVEEGLRANARGGNRGDC